MKISTTVLGINRSNLVTYKGGFYKRRFYNIHIKGGFIKTVVNAFIKLIKISKMPLRGLLHRFFNNRCRFNDVDCLFCSSVIQGESYFVLPIDCFTCKTLSVSSLMSFGSHPNKSTIKFGECAFEYLKGSNKGC